MGFRPKRPAGGGGKPRRRRLTAEDKKAIKDAVKASYGPIPAGTPKLSAESTERLVGLAELRRKIQGTPYKTPVDFVYGEARKTLGVARNRALDPLRAAHAVNLTPRQAHAFFAQVAERRLTQVERRRKIMLEPSYKMILGQQIAARLLRTFMGGVQRQ